jgi:hypothetical protein
VWTTVHLNLPQHKEQHLQRWRKLQWLLIGAFAPEIVAWNAWEQRRRVKTLTQKMRTLHRARHDPHGSLRPSNWSSRLKLWWDDACQLHWLSRARATLQHMWLKVLVCCMIRPGDLPAEEPGLASHHNADQPGLEPCYWDDIHSWYALMGGYAFELSTHVRTHFSQDYERLVLTPDGLLKLYKYWPHLLPEVSQQDIEDRSKSDSLAKILTCLQATWFCIQCISRYANRLPVSLLEVNTLAHAICSLTAYAFWWSKPKDLLEPTKIRGEEADAVATLLYTLSPIGLASIVNGNGQTLDIQARWLPCEPTLAARCVPQALTVAVYRVAIPQTGDSAPPLVILIKDQYWRLAFFQRRDYLDQLQNYALSVQVGPHTVSRLSIIQHYDEMNDIDGDLMIKNPLTDPEGTRLLPDLVLWRAQNFTLSAASFADAMASSGSIWSSYRIALAYLVGYSFASLLYAGLHSVAWYGPFPSELERTLWRISCVTIALQGFTLILAASVSAAALAWGREVAKDWGSYNKVRKVKVFTIAGVLSLVCLLSLCGVTSYSFMVYCCGRVYLIVEGFREILYIDVQVLRTVTWSQYVPHIT